VKPASVNPLTEAVAPVLAVGGEAAQHRHLHFTEQRLGARGMGHDLVEAAL
jgi:hypothetical protein